MVYLDEVDRTTCNILPRYNLGRPSPSLCPMHCHTARDSGMRSLLQPPLVRVIFDVEFNWLRAKLEKLSGYWLKIRYKSSSNGKSPKQLAGQYS